MTVLDSVDSLCLEAAKLSRKDLWDWCRRPKLRKQGHMARVQDFNADPQMQVNVDRLVLAPPLQKKVLEHHNSSRDSGDLLAQACLQAGAGHGARKPQDPGKSAEASFSVLRVCCGGLFQHASCFHVLLVPNGKRKGRRRVPDIRMWSRLIHKSCARDCECCSFEYLTWRRIFCNARRRAFCHCSNTICIFRSVPQNAWSFSWKWSFVAGIVSPWSSLCQSVVLMYRGSSRNCVHELFSSTKR